MDFEAFVNRMKEQFTKTNILLDQSQLKQFFEYMNYLLQENQKINLTAIVEPEEIIIKHFIDSVSILKYISKDSRIIDVGTGAGFPGIPLKILQKDEEIVLLDSLNKRINFLNDVVELLHLEKVKAIHARVEEFSQIKGYRESFDVAVSRAVAPLNVLVEYLLPLTKINGMCICMKGANVIEEINDSKKAIELLGGKIEKVEEFNLIDTEYKRNNIIISKVKETPKNYPRKVGKPAKEPII